MTVATFLSAVGWANAMVKPLAGDASARRYQHLSQNGQSAVLMLAPPALAGPQTPFLHMAHWLSANGFSAPRILAKDLGAGLILLEDFGDCDLLATLSGPPTQSQTRYLCAADLLAALHRCTPPNFLRPYSPAILAEEAGRLLLWYHPAIIGHPASADFTAEFQAIIATTLAPFSADTPVVILRDYHGQNLHWLAGRQGIAQIGLLDFQDAMIGHPAYDLASLIGDVRGTVPPALATDLTARFLANSPHGSAHFNHALAAFGAQRALKILGLFVRLAQRDGKPAYLQMLARTWAVLQATLAHPQLAPLAAFVNTHIPPPNRLIAP